MGWARGYRGYVFESPSDGAVFGPSGRGAGAIDMMHVPMHYLKVMEDRNIPLALLLKEVGDMCYYTYDLGDQYEHRLVVAQVSMDPERRQVTLIEGHGGCPPEDGNGLDGKSNHCYVEFIKKYKRNAASCKRNIQEANRSSNFVANCVTGLPVQFTPLDYNVEFHRYILELVLSGPTLSKPVKKFNSFKEVTKSCGVCSDRLKPLLKCPCGMIHYCSRECQKVDWKRHRKECTNHKK